MADRNDPNDAYWLGEQRAGRATWSSDYGWSKATPGGHDVSNQSDPWFAANGFVWDAAQGKYVPDGSAGAGGVSTPDLNMSEGMDPATQAVLAFASGGLTAPWTLGTDPRASPAGDVLAGGDPFAHTGEFYSSAEGLAPWQSYFDSFGGAARPGNIGIDQTNENQARSWQQDLIQGLQRQAAGDLNSRAQQSLASGFVGAQAQQQALGSAMRGTGGAAGLRAGARGAADIGKGFAGQQQMLLTQEQQAAQAALAQMLEQQRAQDAQSANNYASNWLANNQMQNDWVNFMNQQGLGLALESEQQNAELGRAILGTDVQNRDFAQRVAGQGMQALGTMIDAAAQSGGSGSGGGGGSSSFAQPERNPWEDELNY